MGEKVRMQSKSYRWWLLCEKPSKMRPRGQLTQREQQAQNNEMHQPERDVKSNDGRKKRDVCRVTAIRTTDREVTDRRVKI